MRLSVKCRHAADAQGVDGPLSPSPLGMGATEQARLGQSLLAAWSSYQMLRGG